MFYRAMAISLLGFSVVAAWAKPPAKPASDNSKYASYTIKKGTDLTVDAYDEKLDIFTLIINAEPSVGPNFANSDELRKAIDFEGDKESFAKQRQQMIGSVYQLKKDLKLATEEELFKRAKAVKK